MKQVPIPTRRKKFVLIALAFTLLACNFLFPCPRQGMGQRHCQLQPLAQRAYHAARGVNQGVGYSADPNSN